MKTLLYICLAALIVLVGCSKPQAKSSTPDLSPQTQPPASNQTHPSMKTSISRFPSDLFFTVTDGFKDIAGAAGSVLYCVGAVFATDSNIEYSYYRGQTQSYRPEGTVYWSYP